MKKLLLCCSFAFVVTTTNANEISAYDQAIMNGSGVTIANFTGKGEIVANDVNVSRRDFGDCRDTWSCKKEDLIRYVKNNNGDVSIQPINTPPVEVPEPNTAALLSIVILGLGFRKLVKTNTKHKC
mgnify:CR=1 FL=1